MNRPSPRRVQIFLSASTAEFGSYRDALRHDLDRPDVDIKIQQDFIATGTETLDMLDAYVRGCDALIQLVGDMTGAPAMAPSVAVIRERYPDFGARFPAIAPFLAPDGPAMSYTQWEAWLALYHRKPLLLATPLPGAERDKGYVPDPAQQAAQRAHLDRLASVERFPGIHFASRDRLTVDLLRSGLHDILALAGPLRRPANLPFASLGPLFIGRDALLDRLAAALGPVPADSRQPASAHVLSGMGGVGKTRLAIEFACRHGERYTAQLFVGADSPAALHRNLAALCAASTLDLPQQTDTDQTHQRDAALDWLNRHPGWLLILDNADSEDAAAAVDALLPRLAGGHVLVTSRLGNWSAGLALTEIDTLAPADAARFLLARTDGKRRPAFDDAPLSAAIADELGHLALALEQAGAYICVRRSRLADYLDTLRSQRDQALAWYDPRLMHYPQSVALTWQTSVAQLGEPARRLLHRLAWLAPDPIPETLLDVALPGGSPDDSPFADLAELANFSLVSRDGITPSFQVHRLIQAVSQRADRDDPQHPILRQTLGWLDAAFTGDPDDARNWPRLAPLAPHVIRLARAGADAGLGHPTARLLSDAGTLLYARASYADAEPLMRQALACDESRHGPAHPDVAIRLGNLGNLLLATNRAADAEPLLRRALAIDETSLGEHHPRTAISLNNLAQLLRSAEAEPLLRRALAIDEAAFGADSPKLGIRLNNLGLLLKNTGRTAEAEPLLRRTLKCAEAEFGTNHPQYAVRLNNLALLLRATRRAAEAEPMLRRALAIHEAHLGPRHPDVARDLNNLGTVLNALGRAAEAEPLMRRALAIDEACLGSAHTEVALVLNNLSLSLQALRRFDEAEPLMRRAAGIYADRLGPDHPSARLVAENHASLLRLLGKPAS